MKKLLEISLGIVTSVGGFLEAGSLATAVQAGAAYRYGLVWAIVLGTICLAFLVEMAGRFAAVSKHTIADGIRERFGFNFFLVPLVAILLVNLLMLAAELGGVALALQLATGWSYQVWAIPVAFAMWLLLWKGTFGIIEKGVSMLGLVTVCFIVAAIMLHPPWMEVARGLIPSVSESQPAKYWFMAVNILGASSESESGDLETRLADLSRRIDRRAKEFERRGEFSDIRRATMKDILRRHADLRRKLEGKGKPGWNEPALSDEYDGLFTDFLKLEQQMDADEMKRAD